MHRDEHVALPCVYQAQVDEKKEWDGIGTGARYVWASTLGAPPWDVPH